MPTSRYPITDPVVKAAKFVLGGKDPRRLMRDECNEVVQEGKVGQILGLLVLQGDFRFPIDSHDAQGLEFDLCVANC